MTNVMIYTEENKSDDFEQRMRELEQNGLAEIAKLHQEYLAKKEPYCLKCAYEDLMKQLKSIRERISDALSSGRKLDVEIITNLDHKKYGDMELIKTTPFMERKVISLGDGKLSEARMASAYFEHYSCKNKHNPLLLELDPSDYTAKQEAKKAKK